MAKIEIYSKGYCPFCARAKAVLTQKGAEFTEYEITNDSEKRAEMILARQRPHHRAADFH